MKTLQSSCSSKWCPVLLYIICFVASPPENVLGQSVKYVHEKHDIVSAVLFNPEASYLFSVGPATPCYYWNVDTGKVIVTDLSRDFPGGQYSPSGRYMVNAYSLKKTDKLLYGLWDRKTKQRLLPLEFEREDRGPRYDRTAFSADEKTFAVRLRDQIVIYNLPTLTTHRKFRLKNPARYTAMKYVSDTKIVIGDWSGNLRLLDLKTGDQLWEHQLSQDKRVISLVVVPGSDFLFVSLLKANRHFLRSRDVVVFDWKAQKKLKGFFSNAPTLAASSDGRMICFAGGSEGNAGLCAYEVISGKLRCIVHLNKFKEPTWMAISSRRNQISIAGGIPSVNTGRTRQPVPLIDLYSLSPKTMPQLLWGKDWNNLASLDAKIAFSAMQQIMAAPKTTVPKLKRKLLALNPVNWSKEETYRLSRSVECLEHIDTQASLRALDSIVKTAQNQKVRSEANKAVKRRHNFIELRKKNWGFVPRSTE